MVVTRMQASQVRDLSTPERIHPLDPHRSSADAVEVSRRPSPLVGDYADPLRPKRADLGRLAIIAGDQLSVRITMQQQLGGDSLQEAIRPDDRRRPLVSLRHIDRQRAEHPRKQPNRSLPDRIPAIHLVELGLETPHEARLSPRIQPGGDKRPQVPRRLPA